MAIHFVAGAALGQLVRRARPNVFKKGGSATDELWMVFEASHFGGRALGLPLARTAEMYPKHLNTSTM